MTLNPGSSSASIEDMERVPRTDKTEQAPHHVEETDQFTWTEEEEKQLVRKVDMFLLPTIWLMYLLSYMDRTK